MREDIICKIKAAGVVGAGGAGFPTHVKISAAAQTVVVNGAECEPLLRVDQQLMALQADKLVQGLTAFMTATGAAEGVIALKGKYKAAIAALEKMILDKPIRLHILGDFYPAGDEHVTVYEATGRLVPQGGIPLQVGCIVTNVETLVNAAEALAGKPVTDTFLTVTGELAEPITLKLPIGTSVAEALALAGCQVKAGMQVIDGGPMMGKIVADLLQPITKTTKGLIVLQADHPLIRKRTQSAERIIKQAKAACVQCRYCTDLCPRFLLGHNVEPHRIMRAMKHIDTQGEAVKLAFACSECGVCEQYACFMELSPRKVNSLLKQELAKQGIKPNAPPENQRREPLQDDRKIPVKRLIARLGLAKYDKSAPLSEAEYAVSQVQILLKQHVGAPGRPIVKVGQCVQKGELIAAIPDDSLGANLHASMNGIVTEITDRIVIKPVEGSDRC